jgi:hypothetical protein
MIKWTDLLLFLIVARDIRLEAKAPEDAPAFKAWLQAIAQRVAEAAKEGGFMGFGGVRVSDAEKATLGGNLRRAEAHGLRAPAHSTKEACALPR